MSDKTKVQLEEELIALTADFESVSMELANIEETYRNEVDREKEMLSLQAAANEVERQRELEDARSEYTGAVAKATEIKKNLEAQVPANLGVAGQTARTGILGVIAELFGEL